MAGSRCGAEKVGEPGTACSSRKQGTAQWLMGSHQNDPGASLQELSAAKND